jgi:ferredoxin
MKKIRLICESKIRPELVVEISCGEEILDHTDVPGSPIVYSCRGVACGSCFIEVDRPDVFEPPDDNEKAVLHNMGATGPYQRIACACRIRQNISGSVRVKMGY